MSRMRMLIVAFWVLIGLVLLYQFYEYNKSLSEAPPPQQHFYFFHTNAPPVSPNAARNVADVEQTKFVVQPNTPGPDNFTCLVTLKNIGTLKATGVQVEVRPYRGAYNGDPEVKSPGPPLSDDDPISQFNSWVSFPDLDPGQSSTQSVVFLNRGDYQPGVNPKPQIIFQSANTAHPAMP